jgi:aquaporin Z
MTNDPSGVPEVSGFDASLEPASPDVPPVPGVGNLRIFGAEFVGTTVLMVVGPGTAILAADSVGNIGVALAFGFALLAMAYTIGHVSGCHINPAVTLGFLLNRKFSIVTAAYYWVAQLLGAVLGGLILYVVTEGGDLDNTTIFAANGWGPKIGSPFGMGSAILVEIVFTALLVLVVLSTTTVGYPTGFGGLAVGLTLAMIHLATIPVDNTSVNPARSFGAAIFSGADALGQLWVFIVFPLVGAVLGVLIWLLIHDSSLEETMLGGRRMIATRDSMRSAAHRVEDRLQ